MNPSAEIKIKEVKPQIYIYSCAFGILALWGWWLFENQTDYRLHRGFSAPRAEPISHWVPTIGSPLALITAYIMWRRAVGIAENGILVDARIEKYGGGSDGMRDVTLSYVVAGKDYKVKKTFSESDFAGLQVGDSIQIVADQRHPKRIMLNS